MTGCKRIIAVLLAVALMLSMAVSTGAIIVENDGKEYILRSHTPTTGDVNVLMIRLGFADYPVDNEFDSADSEETLLSYFDGSKGSVNEFYETSSYGKLRLHCDQVYNYNAVHDRDDYAGAFSEYPLSDLLNETLTALDGEIDYADFDSDGDGHLDVVCFDYAGPMDGWGGTWWPHVSEEKDVEIEGKQLSIYSFLRGRIETFKHELGHVFGAADYYSYSDNQDYMIMTYDMMCMNTGDHNGFTKWSYGWLNDEDITFVDKASGDAEVRLAPIETPLGDGKKIAVVAPAFSSDTRFLDEFFLVEYDSGVGNNQAVFDDYGFAPGFRIFHVNASANYDDENARVSFVNSNSTYGINLIHNVRNELDDPRDWDEGEMFFREGDALTPADYPNTGLSEDSIYNGRFSGISFTDFVTGDEPSFKVSFSDEEIAQPEPHLTLQRESLGSKLNLTLLSDQPLNQSSPASEGYEEPYLIDAEGTKLFLYVSAVGTAYNRFNISYINPSPILQPDTDYTLVIPEGYFIYGYQQRVPEFREQIRTESFLVQTQIEKYPIKVGMRYSNAFAVTDNTYGRIVMDADTASCDFIEFNLNGEEIARQTFTAPVTYETPKFLLDCSVYRLFDGNFAMCVGMYDRLHFFKFNRNADVISDVFTITDDNLSGYINTTADFKPVPFKDGLINQLNSADYRSQMTVNIDFVNEPTFVASDERQYLSLDRDHYIIKSIRNNEFFLDVYDRSDTLTVSIPIENNFMGAFIEDGQLHVLARTNVYDEDYNRISTLYHDVYDNSGVRLSSEDITERSKDLKNLYMIDAVIPTGSGYYSVQKNVFTGESEVFVCDADWNKLGTFNFPSATELEFLGECGLTTAYQYFSGEDDSVNIVSRFNIGEFDIVPKRNLLGDANLDGEVDIIDATTIQRYEVKSAALSDTALRLADVDKDDNVCVIDATWIQRWELNMKAPKGIGAPFYD